jgi:hypothetical protein
MLLLRTVSRENKVPANLWAFLMVTDNSVELGLLVSLGRAQT